jgi:hypothetical protein
MRKLEVGGLDLFEAVKKHMGWDETQTAKWFSTENPHFGGATPDRLMDMGRGHKVKQFIESAIEESTPPATTSQETKKGGQ